MNTPDEQFDGRVAKLANAAVLARAAGASSAHVAAMIDEAAAGMEAVALCFDGSAAARQIGTKLREAVHARIRAMSTNVSEAGHA
jgi:hypothetical protein